MSTLLTTAGPLDEAPDCVPARMAQAPLRPPSAETPAPAVGVVPAPVAAERRLGHQGLLPARRLSRRPGRSLAVRRLVDDIDAGFFEDPGPGGWSGGFANQARWDPHRSREWRCWAQSGPTWSAHCGAEVAASDSLGLCQRHRRSLLETEGDADCVPSAEHALSAS